MNLSPLADHRVPNMDSPGLRQVSTSVLTQTTTTPIGVTSKMVERSKAFAIAGLSFSGLAAVFLIASFASPYWVESKSSVNPSGFEKMGLWVACFRNYYPINRPITNKRYEGCWAAISYEMRDLYDHFYPGWMRAVQGMVTISALLSVACVIINIIYVIKCCPLDKDKFLVFISAILSFVSAFFLMVSTILFGVNVDQDRDWLPHPDSTFLSWAYGFGILAAFLSLFSGMCMMTDFFRIRLETRYDDRSNSRGQSARYTAPPPAYDRAVKHRY